MNKISFKIGLLFFISIFLLESISMFFLHNNILHSRVHDELSALQTRGNNHREILEASFHEETIKHIALMESRTDTQVILTNPNGAIYMSSNKVTSEMKRIIKSSPKKIPHEGLILEEDWQHEEYIASISPIQINGKINGYIYMFQKTQKVKELISGLNHHFILAGVMSLIFMFIIIIFLTRFVTHPVIQMSEATKRISKGDFSVSLPTLAKDEIGELGESINILASELELLKNERNEFLASISHELRTPLTYIKGYAEIARRPDTKHDDRENYLSIIFEEAEKLSILVKELFNLAKMDENNFSIEKETILLAPYFQGIYEKISPAFNEINMELVLNCSNNIYAEIDPIRFEQVILNLLDNARKYSEPFTEVAIDVIENAGEVSIKVKDQGKGIPEEDLPRIFERFYRVDKSRTRALGGSGLGLSIVKQLVEAHGGTLQVTSTTEIGTVFEIILKGWTR
ncbi:HAMP domain-containing sensor histidine kinase [Neobacillus sp. PS3-40]|uniref:HAMP domain-containing sensor histidine kinase n=1 Tax=Neobacillus sp. PS3-40 TaxID=3070679 RepID=UPI0027DFD82F|nr:HAMP domain-containing sensor histidine kinase [Neobacillus sp. PS3-40]WML45934.1 HAMP domain-containing sensor histidine kinase [Neobacillus sp. PS3-40]